MAIKANLVVDQGTDFSTSIDLLDDDGNVINLAGYTANAQFRKTYSSSNAVTFSTSLQASNGVVTISLTANQTSNVEAGRYVYDVFLTTSGNVKSRIVEGIVTITPRVTR